MKKRLDLRFFLSIFILIPLSQACVPLRYLNPPSKPYDLDPIPYQITYKTEHFFFQPPLSKNWKLLTYIMLLPYRDERMAPLKETKITVYNPQAQAWISVAYLELVEGKRFENQKDLVLAFVAGEEEYLAGNLDAPITKTHLHQGFRGMFNPVSPKTMKIGDNYFKVIKWYSVNVDGKQRFCLDIYITPAKDLSGVFVIAMVSPETPSAKTKGIKKDLRMVVGSFEALR